MKYMFPDEVVMRMAAVAYHDDSSGNAHGKISNLFHSINKPETAQKIMAAHTTDAMQMRFKSKDDENSFKKYFATTSAINRGMLEPVSQPAPKGKRSKKE